MKCFPKQSESRRRKSLRELQESNSESTFIEKEMVKTKEKNITTTKKLKVVEKLAASEKENVPTVRRSKRKTVSESINYSESPVESATVKSTVNTKSRAKKAVPKGKQTRSTTKNELKKDSSQTKLNFSTFDIPEEKEFPDIKESKTVDAGKCTLGVSFSLGATEDSGYAPSAGTSRECSCRSSMVFNSPAVKNYLDKSENILTASSLPTSYWMDLAEQRRIALEKALQENELLQDQLAVLEVENSQLKNLLTEAEEMARILKGIIE